MRVFVLTAFFALQLSVFACGFEIHAHALDADTTQSAQVEMQVDADELADADHACHVHTSHTMIELETFDADEVFMLAFVAQHFLTQPKLKKLSSSIEYPPKNA